MNKTLKWVLGLLATVVLTFAFFAMLKLLTSKNDSSTPKEIAAAPAFQGERMTPELLLTLGRLSDPQVSPDGKTILYGVSYTSLEQNRSCRQLFTCSLEGGDRKQLSHSGTSLSNARWIDDSHIAYIKGGQIYSSRLGSKGLRSEKCLSDVPEGISEFSLSPDGAMILYTSTVPGPVKTPSREYADLDKAQAYEAEDLMHRHWDHWVTEIPHSYICPMSGTITKERSTDLLGSNSPYELPTEPFGGIEQLGWSPDGKAVAYSCRKLTGKQYAFSTNTEIYIFDIAKGETTQVTFGGGYDTDPVWSPDGSRLAWISMERDGYEADKQRLMVASIGEGWKVGEIVEASKCFKYNVAGPSWGEDSKSIWFNSLCEGVQGIFCATLRPEGSWTISRATPEADPHNYSTPFLVKGDKLYASVQSMNFPTELVSIEEGVASNITSENEPLLGALEEPRMESRIIETVDGKPMQTWVMYPPQFDPSKTYPAIVICLGGPQGTNDQSWSYRWCYRLMAEQGYIVVLPNRRGTTAFGQEWTEQISGDYGGLNMQDYLSAARTIKAEPYCGKVAAVGASYGGYSVYYLCGMNDENLFDCFIAHAGIFNEEQMYYTTEEMWFPNFDNGGLREYAYEPNQMGAKGDGITFGGIQQAGSPWSNDPKAVRHYGSFSPDKNILKWHTPLLVLHGGMDFRIPVEQGMAAFNSAQLMGVPSKMVIFPEENHWILQPQNALYWHRTFFDWLNRWLK